MLNPAILKEKNVMNFEMTVEYFSCINMYRILETDSHQFFSDKIASFQIEHEYATRSTSLELINLPFYRLTKCKKSFLYSGLCFWNRLPISTRNIPSNMPKFKRSLRSHIFDRI